MIAKKCFCGLWTPDVYPRMSGNLASPARTGVPWPASLPMTLILCAIEDTLFLFYRNSFNPCVDPVHIRFESRMLGGFCCQNTKDAAYEHIFKIRQILFDNSTLKYPLLSFLVN